jgi:hypoxanthine phosphoribosyltransferase
MKLEVTPKCYHSYISENKDGKPILTISPNSYYELLWKFTEYLKPRIPKIKYVYGIPKGGMSIAQYIAYHLKLELKTNLNDLEIVDHFLLIVDDVIETGLTLDYFTRKFPWCSTAVLHRKPEDKRAPEADNEEMEPTYYLHDMDGHIWIRYPYEPVDDPINR